MKFLEFKKNNLPEPESLRPAIFDVQHFWFISLVLFFTIFIFTALIGFRIFYSHYSTSHIKDNISEEASGINVERLNDAIKNRQDFRDMEIELLPDPSL